MENNRRKTRSVKVGSVTIGGNAPISIQSMTNTDTREFLATLEQVNALYKSGCEIVRVSVPDEDSLTVFEELVISSPVPLVADIHYDYRLAIGAIERGAAKVRINPGNIGGLDKAEQVLKAAMRTGAAVRIGVNSGSLPKDILAKHNGPSTQALVDCALYYAKWLEQVGFDQAVFSLKSSDVLRTIEAYKLFSQASDFPLHIGVTEAGTILRGTVRSAAGLGVLLASGIGDTLRVSLTADPVQEVVVAKELLSCLGLRPRKLELISCPTCARTSGDLISLAQEIESELEEFSDAPLKIAVMGCSVNGPGEARDAHLGIALAKGKAVLFRNGQPVELLPLSQAAQKLVAEARELASAIGR